MQTPFDECVKLVEKVLERFQPRDDATQVLSDRDATWLRDKIVAAIKENGFLGEGAVLGGRDRPEWLLATMKEAWKLSRLHAELRTQAEMIVTALQIPGLINLGRPDQTA